MTIPAITWLYLLVAIGFEVAAIAFLEASVQFTRPVPLAAMLLCNVIMFYFMSLVLKEMPLGVTYAVWSGAGIVLITLVGFVVFGQRLDLRATAGIGLIVGGVVLLNLR